MSLVAVQEKVREVLDGLTAVGVPPALAYVQPPIVDDIVTAPRIYIWGGHLEEERYSMPRGYAQKIVKHRLDIYVLYVTENDPELAALFTVELDAIRQALRSMPMPVEITDGITGEVSVLQWIGENMSQDYSTPTALESQRLLEHSAYLAIAADEILSLA